MSEQQFYHEFIATLPPHKSKTHTVPIEFSKILHKKNSSTEFQYIFINRDNQLVEISEKKDVGARSVFMDTMNQVGEFPHVQNMVTYMDFLPGSERKMVEYYLGERDLCVLDRIMGKLGVFSFFRQVVLDYDIHHYVGGIREFDYHEGYHLIVRNDGKVFFEHKPVKFKGFDQQEPPEIEIGSIGFKDVLLGCERNLYQAEHNYGKLDDFTLYHTFSEPIKHILQDRNTKWVFLKNGHIYLQEKRSIFQKINLNFGNISKFSKDYISFMNDNLDVFIQVEPYFDLNSISNNNILDASLRVLKFNLKNLCPFECNSYHVQELNMNDIVLLLYNDPTDIITQLKMEKKQIMQGNFIKHLSHSFSSDISFKFTN